MKEVIKGKFYDTAKSEFICDCVSKDKLGIQSLYLTKNGKYFIIFEFFRIFYGGDYLYVVSKWEAKHFMKYCKKQLMENNPEEYIRQYGSSITAKSIRRKKNMNKEKDKKIFELTQKFNWLFTGCITNDGDPDTEDNDWRVENALAKCYKILKEIGSLLEFDEPHYWVDAYDEFVESEPNFTECVVEVNYYLFALAATKDKEPSLTLRNIYKSNHDFHYKSMMFLFAAICNYFYDYELLTERVD